MSSFLKQDGVNQINKFSVIGEIKFDSKDEEALNFIEMRL